MNLSKHLQDLSIKIDEALGREEGVPSSAHYLWISIGVFYKTSKHHVYNLCMIKLSCIKK
jgi:hypothetical protein